MSLFLLLSVSVVLMKAFHLITFFFFKDILPEFQTFYPFYVIHCQAVLAYIYILKVTPVVCVRLLDT